MMNKSQMMKLGTGFGVARLSTLVLASLLAPAAKAADTWDGGGGDDDEGEQDHRAAAHELFPGCAVNDQALVNRGHDRGDDQDQNGFHFGFLRCR